MALGSGFPASDSAPPAPPLGLATLPPSPREVAYPRIGAAHAATSLGTPADVTAARASVAAPHITEPGLPAVPLGPGAIPEPIETVITRRGSTRRFPREPIQAAQLATILGAAGESFPTDCPVAPEAYVIVNDVAGLDPGTYVSTASNGYSSRCASATIATSPARLRSGKSSRPTPRSTCTG